MKYENSPLSCNNIVALFIENILIKKNIKNQLALQTN